MKSSHRHDLETNELADALGRLITRLKPHANAVLTVAAVVALGLAVLLALVNWGVLGGPSQAALAFTEARLSPGVTGVRGFVADHGGSKRGRVAKLILADRLLMAAVARADADGNPVSESQATAYLAEAATLAQEVSAASEDLRPLAEVKAALVMIQQGDLAGGKAKLEAVGSTYPTSAAATAATAHLEDLAGYEPVAFSDEPLDFGGEAEVPSPEVAPAPETEAGEGEPSSEPAAEAPAPQPETPETETDTPDEPAASPPVPKG